MLATRAHGPSTSSTHASAHAALCPDSVARTPLAPSPQSPSALHAPLPLLPSASLALQDAYWGSDAARTRNMDHQVRLSLAAAGVRLSGLSLEAGVAARPSESGSDPRGLA